MVHQSDTLPVSSRAKITGRRRLAAHMNTGTTKCYHVPTVVSAMTPLSVSKNPKDQTALKSAAVPTPGVLPNCFVLLSNSQTEALANINVPAVTLKAVPPKATPQDPLTEALLKVHKLEDEMKSLKTEMLQTTQLLAQVTPLVQLTKLHQPGEVDDLNAAGELLTALANEVIDRVTRARQVVIFNVPDHTPLDKVARTLLGICEVNPESCSCIRLRKTNKTRSCPIVIKFGSQEMARRFLDSSYLIRQQANMGPILIKPDKTPLQRAFMSSGRKQNAPHGKISPIVSSKSNLSPTPINRPAKRNVSVLSPVTAAADFVHSTAIRAGHTIPILDAQSPSTHIRATPTAHSSIAQNVDMDMSEQPLYSTLKVTPEDKGQSTDKPSMSALRDIISNATMDMAVHGGQSISVSDTHDTDTDLDSMCFLSSYSPFSSLVKGLTQPDTLPPRLSSKPHGSKPKHPITAKAIPSRPQTPSSNTLRPTPPRFRPKSGNHANSGKTNRQNTFCPPLSRHENKLAAASARPEHLPIKNYPSRINYITGRTVTQHAQNQSRNDNQISYAHKSKSIRPDMNWPSNSRHVAKLVAAADKFEQPHRQNYLLRTPHPAVLNLTPCEVRYTTSPAVHNHNPNQPRNMYGWAVMPHEQTLNRNANQTGYSHKTKFIRPDTNWPSRYEAKLAPAADKIEQPRRQNYLLRTPNPALLNPTPHEVHYTTSETATPGQNSCGHMEQMSYTHAAHPHPPIPSRQSAHRQQHAVVQRNTQTHAEVPFLWNASSCGPPFSARQNQTTALHHLTRFLELLHLMPSDLSQTLGQHL